MRSLLVSGVAAAVLLVGAAPAAPPDAPVTFIKVDELKAMLDGRARGDVIDARHWPEYDELHIKGARSMPLRAVGDRSKEISKTGLVVFY